MSHRLLIAALFLFAGLGAGVPAGSQEIERIAAVVNDDVISTSDLRSRLDLSMLASGLPPTDENRERLRPQVLRQLIDESLQRQEAERFDIEASQDDIDQAVSTIASNNGMTPDQLLGGLEQAGIPPTTLIEQVAATLAWRDLVRARLMSEVAISEDEIDDAIARITANRGQPEYLVAEIFLSVDDPTQEAQVAELAEQLVQEMRRGANFAAVAQQFSQSPTAASAGDLGWVMSGQLDPAIDRALTTMVPGQLSPPIRTVGGFHIILVRDTRIVAATNPDEVIVHAYQLVLSLPAAATQADVDRISAELQNIIESVRGCDQLQQRAQSIGADDGLDLGTRPLGEFDEQARAMMQSLPVGQPSQIAPLNNGRSAAVYMVCDRQFPDDAGINRDEIANTIGEERVGMLARRYLRDLRNAAYIDLRV
ncbi:MAG: peptidylprolyl isomerase [Rhodospirillaceae bacterium]|nr:peptidylprolyl isomerase [Rhodospirillaceae bacterium]